MTKAVYPVEQRFLGPGGLLIVWFLMLLAGLTSEPVPTPDRQAYLSSASSSKPARSADAFSVVHGHDLSAVVGARSSFSFLPGLAFLPCCLPLIHRLGYLIWAEPLRRQTYCFRLLRPVFEHQITINAP